MDKASHPPLPARSASARLAGALYLGTIIFGLFAEMGVRGSLIVRDDASATASALLAHQALFRASIAADLAMLACYIGVTALFCLMFMPVSRRVSLAAAGFSLIGIAILAVDGFFLIAALRLVDAAPTLATAIDAPQRAAMALLALRLHGDGYDLSLVFFGVYCLMLGWLVWRSTFLPRSISALMALAGVCYLLNSIADLAVPALGDALPAATMLPTLIGETVLALWLLVFGARPPASAHHR